jgi:hypothetical protein
MENTMTNQISQEELDKDTDAMIIQMNREQRFNYIKFGAVILLTFMAFFTILYITATIPSAVMSLFGQ